MIGDSGEQIVLPAILSLIVLWVARSLGFFKLPPIEKGPQLPYIHLWQLIAVFAIYLASSLFVPLFALQFLAHVFPNLGRPEFGATSLITPQRVAYSQIATLLTSSILLFLFCLFQKDRASMRAVWKRSLSPPTLIRKDFGMGVIAWAVSFPLVSIIGTIADMLINLLFGQQQYEQVAVRYLKTSLSSELPMILALVTIILIAPFLEEFLFRGFLQNFLKRLVGRKAAIMLAALTFALFHFSLSQDLGNVPLVASLFVLALFLGFIYERQQSLFASIGLHMTFNTISVLRILFSSDG